MTNRTNSYEKSLINFAYNNIFPWQQHSWHSLKPISLSLMVKSPQRYHTFNFESNKSNQNSWNKSQNSKFNRTKTENSK